MSDYKVTDSELTGIANAIRTKGGTSSQLVFPDGFTSAIGAIPTGGGTIQQLSVNSNGTYTPPSGVDGYAPVVVNVPGGGGATILTGTSEPSASVGSNGDIYLLLNDLIQDLVTSESDLNITVTANSYWPNFDPWKAFSTSGSWVGNGGDPHWLQVELQQATPIISVDFISRDSWRSHAVSRVGYSDDGINFIDAVLAESTMINDVGHVTLDQATTAKYFRFYFDGTYASSSYYPIMSEVKIYSANGTTINKSYVKVNGAWINLIGANINDVTH